MRILKLCRSCVLEIVTSVMLLVGSAHASESNGAANLSMPHMLYSEPAEEPTPSDMSGARLGYRTKGIDRETSDSDTFLRLGARLQFRFPTLQGDSVNRGGRLAMFDSSDVTLRRGRIKLGEHPFLPWIEVYSEYDFKGRSFLSEQPLLREGIDDQFRGTARHLRGGYFQVGYFFHEWWERVPAPLEIRGRVALVDPAAMGSGLKQEWTLGANWFFRDYGNKITTDISYIGMDRQDADESAMRVQVRWDISF